MRDQNYSKTAEWMAILRTLEQHRPAEQRILTDPRASVFIPRWFHRLMASGPISGRLIRALFHVILPGGIEYVAVRARLVDDIATRLIAEGLDQLVLLGAGFDTMALRLAESLRSVRVFEVDHPATQTTKRDILASRRAVRHNLTLSTNVVFVPVNFEKEDFASRLLESGYDPSQRTFICWLGVVYYLTRAAVEHSMRQMAGLLSLGSHLVFDYVRQDVVSGPAGQPTSRRGMQVAARMGEPFLFGIDPVEAPSFLAGFGFRLIDDLDAHELQRRYCPSRQPMVDISHIALCRRDEV